MEIDAMVTPLIEVAACVPPQRRKPGLDRHIDDLYLDALAAGGGPDTEARNTIESSREWRDQQQRRYLP